MCPFTSTINTTTRKPQQVCRSIGRVRQPPGTFTEVCPGRTCPTPSCTPGPLRWSPRTSSASQRHWPAGARMKSSATSGATGDEREQTQGAERVASSRDSLVPRRGRLSLLKLLIEQHNIETPPACLPARPRLAEPIQKERTTRSDTLRTRNEAYPPPDFKKTHTHSNINTKKQIRPT